MNGRLTKKVRKEVNQQLVKNYSQIYQSMIKENLFRRLVFAWKIIWKSKKEVKFRMRSK